MKIIRVFVLVLLLTGVHFGQYYEYSNKSGIGIPFFNLTTHQNFNADLKHSTLLVMAEFLYDDLTFLKTESGSFEANFELIFAIYDQKDNVLASRVVNKKFTTEDFELTNSRDSTFVQQESFEVLPGKYKLLVKSIDLNTEKIAQRKVEILIQDFAQKELSISNVFFLKQATFDSIGHLIHFKPSFGNNFNIRSGSFYIYFDIFRADSTKPIDLTYKMSHKRSPVEIDSTVHILPATRVSSHLIKVNRTSLRHNKYTLELTITDGIHTTKRTQEFSFYWSDVPGTVEDISLALRQMTYILSQDSINKYEDADLESQQAFFKRFWKEHDPDPSTERNELKNEYFKRVNYANAHFSAMGQAGWLTDRGRILIKFGPPDDIERHPFEMDRKPFVIWRYYALRKVFYFVDVTGFGDYRLHPDFMDVEYQ